MRQSVSLGYFYSVFNDSCLCACMCSGSFLHIQCRQDIQFFSSLKATYVGVINVFMFDYCSKVKKNPAFFKVEFRKNKPEQAFPPPPSFPFLLLASSQSSFLPSFFFPFQCNYPCSNSAGRGLYRGSSFPPYDWLPSALCSHDCHFFPADLCRKSKGKLAGKVANCCHLSR